MRTTKRAVAAAALGAALVVPLTLLSRAADHRDGPILVNTATQGQSDINDIYVFQSPANPNNTVFVFTFQPFPGNVNPMASTATDPSQFFDIKIDTTGDAVEDITFRITFGPPDANSVQDVTLRGLPSTKFPPTGILARGRTGTTAPLGVNIPIAGGGMFRCGIHDDPFFFDAGAFSTFVANGMGGFPRPPGQAHNFFGPNVNTFAAIIEIPSAR